MRKLSKEETVQGRKLFAEIRYLKLSAFLTVINPELFKNSAFICKNPTVEVEEHKINIKATDAMATNSSHF